MTEVQKNETQKTSWSDMSLKSYAYDVVGCSAMAYAGREWIGIAASPVLAAIFHATLPITGSVLEKVTPETNNAGIRFVREAVNYGVALGVSTVAANQFGYSVTAKEMFKQGVYNPGIACLAIFMGIPLGIIGALAIASKVQEHLEKTKEASQVTSPCNA